MSPDELPIEVTDRIYAAPFSERFSQNDVRTLLVHFWPSLRAHFLGEAADLVAAYTGNSIDANAQMLRREAAGAGQ